MKERRIYKKITLVFIIFSFPRGCGGACSPVSDERYDDDLEKRSKRRRNKKKGIIEITAEETSPEAVKETATDSVQSVEAARNGFSSDSIKPCLMRCLIAVFCASSA